MLSLFEEQTTRQRKSDGVEGWEKEEVNPTCLGTKGSRQELGLARRAALWTFGLYGRDTNVGAGRG